MKDENKKFMTTDKNLIEMLKDIQSDGAEAIGFSEDCLQPDSWYVLDDDVMMLTPAVFDKEHQYVAVFKKDYEGFEKGIPVEEAFPYLNEKERSIISIPRHRVYHPVKKLQLNVAPTEFHGKYRTERENIKEIVRITDTELTYSTFHGDTVTKKIDHKTTAHVFTYGFVPVYILDDGEEIWVYSYRWFDWRNYPLEEIEEERRKGLERLSREGIKLPKVKRLYPPLFSENSLDDK